MNVPQINKADKTFTKVFIFKTTFLVISYFQGNFTTLSAFVIRGGLKFFYLKFFYIKMYFLCLVKESTKEKRA